MRFYAAFGPGQYLSDKFIVVESDDHTRAFDRIEAEYGQKAFDRWLPSREAAQARGLTEVPFGTVNFGAG